MTIKLNETGLTAVVVPKDARDYQTKWISEKLYLLYYYNSHAINKLQLGKVDFEILGEVTKDFISFDVRPFLKDSGKYYDGQLYYCFGKESDKIAWDYDAFYSLLNSLDIYLVNPIEKPNMPFQDKIMYEGLHERYKVKLSEWQSYESKLIKKVVILKEINNDKRKFRK